MPLPAAKFMMVRDELNETAHGILFGEKGADYGQGDIEDNKLSNFERFALMFNSTPQQVCAIYMMKHIDAILKWVRTGQEGSEPFYLRIVDARNYLDLLYGIYVSQKEGQ